MLSFVIRFRTFPPGYLCPCLLFRQTPYLCCLVLCLKHFWFKKKKMTEIRPSPAQMIERPWTSPETGRASAMPRTGSWCSQDAPWPCFQLARDRVMPANWLPWKQGLQQLQAHLVQVLPRGRKRLDSRFKTLGSTGLLSCVTASALRPRAKLTKFKHILALLTPHLFPL